MLILLNDLGFMAIIIVMHVSQLKFQQKADQDNLEVEFSKTP